MALSCRRWGNARGKEGRCCYGDPPVARGVYAVWQRSWVHRRSVSHPSGASVIAMHRQRRGDAAAR